jgi:A/G-specific adenine glycosylase
MIARTLPKTKAKPIKLEKLVSLLLDWFSSNARDLPWRRTHDPYAIWVSEIMLQQTQVKTVIPFWERWLRELPTIEAAAKAPSAKIHKLWEGLGYYTRVRNLQKAALTIVEQHDGIFPKNFEAVLDLPGIGRYTAGAICSIAFNQPTPILDGNVIRVLTRVFGITENPKEKQTNALLWKLAEALVSEAEKQGSRGSQPAKLITPVFHWENHACSALNQSLMELGALVCTPRNPQCLMCPAKGICIAHKENRTAELPNLGERETATARRFLAFILEHDGEFLVRQRPEGIVNSHLWEFPNLEVTSQKPDEAALAKDFFGIPPAKFEPLCTVKHSITRYRITVNAFTVGFNQLPAKLDGVWKSPARMRQLAFTAAHKKLASFAANRILSGR